MQTLSADNVKKLLQELSTSSFRFERRAAAYKLGQLTISNDEIVWALATAAALDDEAHVRSAALQALQSPGHQAFLKDHPDFIQEATKSAAHKHAQEKQQAEKAFVIGAGYEDGRHRSNRCRYRGLHEHRLRCVRGQG